MSSRTTAGQRAHFCISHAILRNCLSCKLICSHAAAREQKLKNKPTPFGVNLLRSQELDCLPAEVINAIAFDMELGALDCIERCV